MNIETRLERLEKQMQFYKRLVVALALVIVAGVTMGQTTSYEDIVCRSLTVVDDSGNTFVTINIDQGVGKVTTYGAKGETLKATTPRTRAQPTQGGWQVPANWAKVKKGMSFDQVKQILGTPTSTDMVTTDMGNWYYQGWSDLAKANITGNIVFMSKRVIIIDRPVF